jgi:hypothetical protein
VAGGTGRGARGSRALSGIVDDPRFEAGMPVLDRQAATPAGPSPVAGLSSVAGASSRSVPEARPTPLQKHYVLLSAPALVLGTVAITALEMGVALGSPLVKACVLVAAPLLAVANADAIVRIWRSAWAWMPVDVAKGRFRLAWVAVGVVLYALLLIAAWLVVVA